MPLGMLAQVLWEAMEEGGQYAGPARPMAALQTASTSSYKEPDVKYSENRTEPIINKIRLRNISLNTLSTEELNVLLPLYQQGTHEK